ncbi:ABC transporter substrate-binding protein [Cohnella abietis]|uniref:ABC transporter substrate-binding protein n=1 Tax=Cohnella abietis TaxID=2507935 RepID=A0A3T1D1E9_9BACL|nr:extracellular solute-binding protein [Cohnella abietis]BBI31942.1 ABC transporter substrate-binding protein [Cohnella abietis]
MFSSKFLKRSTAVVICTMLLFVMAACGGNNDTKSEPTSTNGTESPSATANEKPVTLRLIGWNNVPTVEALKKLNEKFSAKYPNIKVDMNIVDTNSFGQLKLTRMTAGDVDIIQSAPFYSPPVDWAVTDKPTWISDIEQGMYTDLSGQPWVGNYTEDAQKAMSWEGKIYGIPTGSIASNGIFYNKDLFEKNGWSAPKTWDDFVVLVDQIKKSGISAITIGGKDGWPANMMMNNLVGTVIPNYEDLDRQLWTGERKFNDEQFMKVWERMDQWNGFFDKGILGVDYNAALSHFVTGKAAMLADGSWRASEISGADANVNYGYFPLPNDAGDQVLQGNFDIGYLINAKSPNQDAALKWLAFLNEKENYTEFENTQGLIPTQIGTVMESEFMKELGTSLKLHYESLHYTPKGVGKYGSATAGALLKSFGGPIATTKELADLVQGDWDKALKSNK